MKTAYSRREAIKEFHKIVEEIAEEDRSLNEILRTALKGSMHPREFLARQIAKVS